MTEEFLQYIWKFSLFSFNLSTTEGEPLEILKTGEQNTHAGPDFFNAKIKIGNTIWAGNVEVHINASDWEKHEHNRDTAYANVVLHVVFNADKAIHTNRGEAIPVLEMKNKFKESLYAKYTQFKQSKHWISCQAQFNTVSPLIINNWLDRLLVERLERKSQAMLDTLQSNHNNWSETFYQHIANSFGLKINTFPFELLAKSIPLTCISKHKNSLLQIEAMLFGQAGMLNKNFNDDYPKQLKKEYLFLKQKFGLQNMDEHLWKFLRLRPSNFPTIRISQFANLLFQSSELFAKIIACQHIDELTHFFNVTASPYWETHYRFDMPSVKKKKPLGKQFIYSLIINTIVPLLFVYGKKKNNESMQKKALQFLEQLPPEQNTIIKKWSTLNIPLSSAFITQALLELKNEYCTHKKCLFCTIGNQLLKHENPMILPKHKHE